jgi:hypothetical protein
MPSAYSETTVVRTVTILVGWMKALRPSTLVRTRSSVKASRGERVVKTFILCNMVVDILCRKGLEMLKIRPAAEG